MPELRPGLRRKWLLLLCSAAAAVLLLALFMPLVVEQFVLPRLLARAELPGYRVAVSRFGLHGCSLHLAGAPDNALLSAGTLTMDWTVTGLLQGRLDRVTGDGLLVNLASLQEQDPAAPPSSEQPPAAISTIPLVIDHIELRNSYIALPMGSRQSLLALSFSGQQQKETSTADSDSLGYRTTLAIAGQELHAEFTIDPRQGKFTGSGRTILDIPSLMAVFPAQTQGPHQGTARVTVQYKGTLLPFRLEKIDTLARLHDFQGNWPHILLRSAGQDGASVTLAGGNGKYQLIGSDFALDAPVTAVLAFTSEISPAAGAVKWQGTITARPTPGQEIGGKVVLERTPVLRLHHEGKAGDGTIEAWLQTDKRDQETAGSYAFRYQNNLIRAEDLAAEARMLLRPESANQRITATFVFKGSGLTAEFAGGRGRVPAFALQGSADLPGPTNHKGPAVLATLNMTDGSLELDNQDIRLQAMQLALPFSWPLQDQASPGDFRINDIDMRQVRLGSFAGAITQKEGGYSLRGEARSTLLPASSIKVDGAVHLPHAEGTLAEVNYSTRGIQLAMQDLAALFPALHSLTGSGTLDLAGSMRIDQCGMRGELATKLHDGNFALPEADLAVEGVTLELRLPNLPRVESAPAQKLTIGTIRGKKIVVTDMNTSFRVESPESLFIENISGKWSSGRIFTSNIRLQKDKPELAFALIGDRLQLSEILTQLGLAEAVGDGTLSGRIPVIYKDQKISVDDGFLFTSPGEKGTLKIKQSTHLTLGLPMDTPQLSPLHFAGAALGDFEYNWAKLNILSQEDTLLLQLQIDGKPRQRMPYRFDARNNVFVRLAEGAPGGIDQPIKLDVNFKVPVNELIQNQKILLPLLRNLK